ncbi:hypothetical protein H6G64_37095 [Calothrix sp. FACHB-156]|nr:hypothetical protein [Calothrix sp. FACHB-156]
MSQITIQCRLVASESTRQQLWKLMAEKNTPLINELLTQVAQQPEFESWWQKGKGSYAVLSDPVKNKRSLNYLLRNINKIILIRAY